MLTATLWRHRGNGTLNQLEQGLLNALTRYISCNGWVVRFTRDFVDLIDVDDTGLGLFYIVIALLQQFLNDVFHILAHITSLGECGCIGDRERHVEQPSQGLRQKGLARSSRSDQQNITLGELNFILAATARLHALVMVINRYRQHLLGIALTDDVLIQNCFNFMGFRELFARNSRLLLHLLTNDVIT